MRLRAGQVRYLRFLLARQVEHVDVARVRVGAVPGIAVVSPNDDSIGDARMSLQFGGVGYEECLLVIEVGRIQVKVGGVVCWVGTGSVASVLPHHPGAVGDGIDLVESRLAHEAGLFGGEIEHPTLHPLGEQLL